MKVDVIRTASTVPTQSASALYLDLNHTAADIAEMFREAAINGNASWGGATGKYQELRQRFTIRYGGDWTSPTYLWSGVKFIKTTDDKWTTKLAQDQQLDPVYWYRGSTGTATFGTGSGQADLTTFLIYDFECRLHTLCSDTDVEDVLFSHLQGRMKFADVVGAGIVSDSVTSYDALWKRIYEQSSRFQSQLAQFYVTPLALGEEHTRRRLAGIVAKAVAVDLMRSQEPWAQIGGGQRYTEWKDEVDAFLTKPPELSGCEMIGQGGGGIVLERA